MEDNIYISDVKQKQKQCVIVLDIFQCFIQSYSSLIFIKLHSLTLVILWLL